MTMKRRLPLDASVTHLLPTRRRLGRAIQWGKRIGLGNYPPDDNRRGWPRLNWNFLTDPGRGCWDVPGADYVDDSSGPHLDNIRVVHEGPGHYFETQHWSPDGCGFLFTESVDTTLNLELFYLDLCKREDDPARLRRLTNHPAWDEQ